MRTKLLIVLCMLAALFGYATAGSAQSTIPPNRKAEVAQIRPRLCPGVPGDDVSRRRIIVTIVNELNKIDNNNWGLLYRLDRQDEDPRPGRLTSDVIVWRPTKEHFDVLSESGTLWIAHPPITDPDWLVIYPTERGGFPGCNGGGQPPVPPVDPPPPTDPTQALLQRIGALEAQVSVLTNEVNIVKSTASSLAAANQELAAGLEAALIRLTKEEQKGLPVLRCSGRALFGIPVTCNVVPDPNP